MTALNKQALRQLAEKATHGEWWSDVVETDGEYGEGEDRVSGYHSYAVYVGSESLLDMTNSTAACIHEEWDHDYHMAWDETAKRNAEFIAAANPDTVLALLDELETKEEQRANWFQMAQKLGEDLDAAENRIAELSASHSKLREGMAAIYNAICENGASTSLSAILTFVKRSREESDTAAGIGVKGE
ncbi:TPA: ead/Ea22-like family protein [Citrobacter freundii]|uniref:ead/Ea22-like family protein n=1 Tax=Citrobacter TaxID=544 RepID=UPI00158479D7|nr:MULTISPECIES: ead/Ea22-like family protein [Citrobacter]MDM3139208.1 ead/Ea22-like family protein [Citrobacter sp. Cf120]NUN37167.1 ead/Ea22-like family protein [Citrobacter freundii]HAT7555815.1 ead/Ea22-like family protein [Citrobacter freundii]HDT6602704.1 ead/Ea22-like family protein [Citrobacter freundii]